MNRIFADLNLMNSEISVMKFPIRILLMILMQSPFIFLALFMSVFLEKLFTLPINALKLKKSPKSAKPEEFIILRNILSIT